MFNKWLAVLLASILLHANPAIAVASPAQPPIEQRLVNQFRVSEIVYSADAKQAAFSVIEPGGSLPLLSSLWLYESGAAQARRLTTVDGNESMPRWSPDGARLAFVEKVDGATRIRIVDARDGKEQPRAVDAKGLEDFNWLGDGSGLAILAEADDGGERVESGMVIGSQYYKRKEIRIFDLASGASKTLTKAPWTVNRFATVPRSKDVVVTAEDKLEPEEVVRRLFVVNGATGTMREFGRVDGVRADKMKVSPDGRHLAYVGSVEGPTTFDLYLQPLRGGAVMNLTGLAGAAIDRKVSSYDWSGDTSLVVTVEEGFGNAVYGVDLDGSKRLLKTFADSSVTVLTAAGEQNLIYAKTADTAPVEVWVDEAGRERQISSLHRDFPVLVKGRLIEYPGTDGMTIQAKLFEPAGAKGPLPTVVLVHGGPAVRWNHGIIDWAQVLVANGYAVIAPNIRGSSGHAQAFLTSNHADWGGGDFRDVMSGLDWLIGQGIANPDRLGIAGWSYGGYMSAWAVTQTQRFKASVAGAGMIDLNVQWGGGLPHIVPYDTWFLGEPWDEPENYRRMSPITHVRAVTTPTMLILGAADTIDPPIQNWMFYRALRMNNVPTELIIYPREGHSLSERRHRADGARRMLEWMNRYLLGNGAP